jgi:signal transduction histidine kinase
VPGLNANPFSVPVRRPIHIQLLLPTLTVVVLAIVLASGATAYWGATRARQTQEDDLRRTATTLAEAKFPLGEQVLRQMSGLSGAEFVFFDEENRLQACTLTLQSDDLQRLVRLGDPSLASAVPRGRRPGVELAGRNYLAQRVPIGVRGAAAQSGWLFVLYSEEQLTAAVRQAAYPALIAGAIAVAAVVLVTTVLGRRFVRPIRRLGNQAAAIARGDFTPVAVGRRDDEIRDLAVSINRMTERLGQYEREGRPSEQLRTLGQLGAGMAHQLRNAATGGRMAIELHQRHCAEPAGQDSLEVALRQFRLMESYLQRFLALGRPRPSQHEAVSLDELVDDVAALVRPACLHAGIALAVVKAAAPLTVRGDADELRQVAVNLVLNAVDAAAGHAGQKGTGTTLRSEPVPVCLPRISIELECLAGRRAALRVCDSGPGPVEALAPRLFDPFVSNKPDGTGLGLFVARQIAEDHHGSLSWERRGDVTIFTMELPQEQGTGIGE